MLLHFGSKQHQNDHMELFWYTRTASVENRVGLKNVNLLLITQQSSNIH